jgi:hypothetical protein
MEDLFSFVPLPSLLGESINHHPDGCTGMILRKIPQFLVRNKSDLSEQEEKNLSIVPLYVLLGVKKQNVLKRMVEQSRLGYTEFVVQKILKPFAAIAVELLFFERASIEAHGQNLLLLAEKGTLQPVRGKRTGTSPISFSVHVPAHEPEYELFLPILPLNFHCQ